LPINTPKIGGVQAGWPAQKAGLAVGDEVVSVEGSPVQTWEEMAKRIQQAQGKEAHLVVKKGDTGQLIELAVTPELHDDPTSGEGGKKYGLASCLPQTKTVSW
jgi:regulator of sigma E protease